MPVRRGNKPGNGVAKASRPVCGRRCIGATTVSVCARKSSFKTSTWRRHQHECIKPSRPTAEYEAVRLNRPGAPEAGPFPLPAPFTLFRCDLWGPLHLKTPIRLDNSAVMAALADFVTVSEAIEVFPGLDDILTGTAKLDYNGNSRPFSKRALFHILQVLPEISVDAVSEANPRWSRGHCSKVCMALRVASKGFASHLARLAAQHGDALPAASLDNESVARFRLLALRVAVPRSRLVTCRVRLLRPPLRHHHRRRQRARPRASAALR